MATAMVNLMAGAGALAGKGAPFPGFFALSRANRSCPVASPASKGRALGRRRPATWVENPAQAVDKH